MVGMLIIISPRGLFNDKSPIFLHKHPPIHAEQGKMSGVKVMPVPMRKARSQLAGFKPPLL